MLYCCEGCGKRGESLGKENSVYPRVVFTNQSAVLCEYCHGRLEGFLTEKWREWFRIQRANREMERKTDVR
jgi:hypothetical protein